MNISYTDGVAVLDAEISPMEKCTLMALLLHIHPVTGLCYPSQATLAKEVGCSERQIRRTLKKLKSKCLVEIHPPPASSGRHTPSYTMPFSGAYRFIEESTAKRNARAEARKKSVKADASGQNAEGGYSPDQSAPRPPTLEEVVEYVTGKGYQIDPFEFHDYYEAIGWRVNGQPIRSWKAKCNIWQRRDELDRTAYGGEY